MSESATNPRVVIQRSPDSRPWQAWIWVALCLAVTGLGYWVGTSAPKQPLAKLVDPVLKVDPAALELGTIILNDKFEWALPIRNTSPSPIRITEFQTSCGCTQVTPKSLAIAPSASETVTLSFDLSRFMSTTKNSRRDATFDIRPVFQASSSGPVAWRLHAGVESPFWVDSSLLSYGVHERVLHGTEGPTKLIVAHLNRDGLSLKAVVDDAKAIVSTMPNVEDSRNYGIAIQPSHELPIGAFQFDVRIVAFDSQDREIAAVRVPVNGMVISVLDMQPPHLLLGAVPTGTTEERTVVGRMRKPGDFRLDTMTSDCPDLALHASTSDFAEELKLKVSIPIVAAGNQRATISLTILTMDGFSESLTIPVSYFGVQ